MIFKCLGAEHHGVRQHKIISACNGEISYEWIRHNALKKILEGGFFQVGLIRFFIRFEKLTGEVNSFFLVKTFLQV